MDDIMTLASFAEPASPAMTSRSRPSVESLTSHRPSHSQSLPAPKCIELLPHDEGQSTYQNPPAHDHQTVDGEDGHCHPRRINPGTIKYGIRGDEDIGISLRGRK